MAGVQVPRIDRIAPQAPEASPRMNVNLPDAVSGLRQRNNQIQQGLADIAHGAAKFEDEAANLAADEAYTEFYSKKKSGLASLKEFEGDPTEQFAKFDEESKTWQAEIEAKYEGSSQVIKDRIKQKLAKANALIQDERTAQEGQQFNVYAGKISKAASDASKDALLGVVAGFDPRDKASEVRVQVAVDAIREPLLNDGKRRGLVTYNEDNTIKDIDPILQAEMKEEISKGLKTTINALNDAGQTEKADYLIEKYKDSLTADALGSLLKGSKETKINAEALGIVDQVRRMNPDAAFAAIEKSGASPEVKEKAREKLNTYTLQQENMVERTQKRAFNNAITHIQQAGEQGVAYVTKEQMWDDPVMKAHKRRMTPDQQKKVEDAIFKPARSNIQAKATMYEFARTGELYKMDYPTLVQYSSGLNEKDQKMFESMWNKEQNPTAPQKRQMFTSMATQLKQEMEKLGLVKKNKYTNRYSPEDEAEINDMNDLLMEAIESYPPGTSMAEQNRYVETAMANYIASGGKAFKPNVEPKKFISAPKAAAKTEAPAKTSQIVKPKTSVEDMNAMLIHWKQANGGKDWNSKDNTLKQLRDSWDKRKK